jgi:hypothetical protein
MSAIRALSASHIAWMTRNQDTENLAYHHRGVALKELHQAIGSFSRENADAILAASMLLSWQATDWLVSLFALIISVVCWLTGWVCRRSWSSLQQGVSTVRAHHISRDSGENELSLWS